MYPDFEREAVFEGNNEAAQEAKLQADESREHAEQFITVLKKAEKRFAALKKIPSQAAKRKLLIRNLVSENCLKRKMASRLKRKPSIIHF
jgi:rubrerythrin